MISPPLLNQGVEEIKLEEQKFESIQDWLKSYEDKIKQARENVEVPKEYPVFVDRLLEMKNK